MLAPAAKRPTVALLERRYGLAGNRVLALLKEARERDGRLTLDHVQAVARETGVPAAHVYGAASFYADLGFDPRGERVVRVCAGTACFAAGGGGHVAAVAQAAGPAASVRRVHCLGYCYGGPAALDGEQACAGPDVAAQIDGSAQPRDPPIPATAAVADPVLLGDEDPWAHWAQARRPDGREHVVREVLTARLRGRAGAAFPVARKWDAAAAAETDGPRYVVANGDEGDPGSFADRLLLETRPHQVLAGLAYAGLAVGARHGFVHVRSEYPRALAAVRAAIEEARAAGHLGAFFDVEAVAGAGSYVAGEETALIHALEGLRGSVAARPPHPTERGLLDRPTAVHNVETLAAVPWIVARGGAAFAARGAPGDSGTKLVCLNERFARPGVYEIELGVSLRHVCEQLGGGLRDGRTLRALQLGGPLGSFLGRGRLDLPLATQPLHAAGVALGHGGVVAFDERTRALDLLAHLWEFAARESCGTCAPCRIGSGRGRALALAAQASGTLASDEHDRLCDTMAVASLCPFGQTVPVAARELLRVLGPEPRQAG